MDQNHRQRVCFVEFARVAAAEANAAVLDCILLEVGFEAREKKLMQLICVRLKTFFSL